jgi:hypothetical protein
LIGFIPAIPRRRRNKKSDPDECSLIQKGAVIGRAAGGPYRPFKEAKPSL